MKTVASAPFVLLTASLYTPHNGGMEKRTPHYALAEIKKAFADPTALNRTYSSKQGADSLGLDDAAVAAVVQALDHGNFDKSMTSHADHKVWQDVYRPKHEGTEIYVKFTVDAANALLLISFKEA